MSIIQYTEYRQQVSQTKSQLKSIVLDYEKRNGKSQAIIFSAMGELLAEYGLNILGREKTLMMFDELSRLVLKSDMDL
jgi:hypothetical protein